MAKITIKTKEDIEILREGGRRLSLILNEVAASAVLGTKAIELDKMAEDLILRGGDIPAFKNYRPDGAIIKFPATLCVSFNESVVHGIPNERKLEDGDVVGLDLGIRHKGLFTDMALTVIVGSGSPQAKRLVDVTRESLEVGIKSAVGGKKIGDIGFAIESFVRPHGYGIVLSLAGHGVGYKVHEPPYVPNYGKAGRGETLVPGMVIALEPMFTLGSGDVKLGSDNFTFETVDASLSAHFEKTILITEGEPLVLTP